MKITKVIDKNYKKPALFKAAMAAFVWVVYCFGFVVFTRNLGVTTAGYIVFAAIFVVFPPITVWLANIAYKRGYRPSPKFVLYIVLAVAGLFLAKDLIYNLHWKS